MEEITRADKQACFHATSYRAPHEQVFRLHYALQAGTFAPSAIHIASALLTDRYARSCLLGKST